MKFTLSWLKDHLKTKATVDEIASKLSAIGLEVESVDNPADEPRRFPRRAHRRSRQAPQRRQAAGHPGRGGEGRAAARGGVRRSQRARGSHRRLRAARHLHSRLEDHAREEARARRRVERHDVLGGRAGAFRGSRGHHRVAGRHGGHVGERYVDVAGSRRPGVRGEADAEPARLYGRARHCARSGRRRPRDPQAGEGNFGRRRGRPAAPPRSSSSSRRKRATPVPCSLPAASRA